MSPRKGDWTLTYLGLQFYPLDPRPEDISPFDIAHHLSLICRFNGACRVFYSVAQHCCVVTDHLPADQPRLRLLGLLHDATEAYCGDMIRPLKQQIELYQRIETGILEAICRRFPAIAGASVDDVVAVKVADNRALMTERRDLMKPSPHAWSITEAEFPVYPERIEPWSPQRAEAQFLERFVALHP